ncbi:MAG: Rid family hydrolase, partial [bacterium]
MPIETIHTDRAPAAIGPYSQGVIANGFLFTAGQIPLDPATTQIVPGDVVAQTEQVFANLAAVLSAAGASWSDVVKSTV